MPAKTYLENLCKEYDLSVFESPRDNLIMIMESAEPTHEEKLQALEAYEAWILYIYAED